MCATRSWSPAMRFTMARSPPAENAFPAPVTTATRVSGSAETSAQTRAGSPCICSSVALYFSGRSIVISRTPLSRRSNRSCSYSENCIVDMLLQAGAGEAGTSADLASAAGELRGAGVPVAAECPSVGPAAGIFGSWGMAAVPLGRARSAHGEAAADADGLTGDVGRLVGGEDGDGVGDVGRLSQPAERDG